MPDQALGRSASRFPNARFPARKLLRSKANWCAAAYSASVAAWHNCAPSRSTRTVVSTTPRSRATSRSKRCASWSLDNEEFEVRDAKTGEDLTRSVLLQIISEHEERGQPMFTTQLLSQIIRFYGDSLQGFMGSYLEKSLQVFLDQQQQFRSQLNNMLGQTPWSMLNDLTERNMDCGSRCSRVSCNAAGEQRAQRHVRPGRSRRKTPSPESRLGSDEPPFDNRSAILTSRALCAAAACCGARHVALHENP